MLSVISKLIIVSFLLQSVSCDCLHAETKSATYLSFGGYWTYSNQTSFDLESIDGIGAITTPTTSSGVLTLEFINIDVPISQITGIEVAVSRSCNVLDSCYDSRIQLRIGNKNLQNVLSSTFWETNVQTSIYGGCGSLWDLAADSDDTLSELILYVEASSAVPASFFIDRVAISVYYNPETAKKVDDYVILAGVLAPAAVIVLIFVVVLVIFMRKKKRDEDSEEIEVQVVPRRSKMSTQSTVSLFQKLGAKRSHNSSTDSIDSPVVKWVIPKEEVTFLRQIGSGSQGIIYEGVWKGLKVAVKKVMNDSPNAMDEFRKELYLLRKVKSHINIVPFYGAIQIPLCFVTQFCEGGSLQIYLCKPSPNPAFLVEAIKGIVNGMIHLHSEEIVHRDLAARNILIDNNIIKIADFGLSRIMQGIESAQTNSNIGPLKWMAPELLSEKLYSQKSDIWSFAVLIWEILHPGKTPYPEMSAIDVASKVVERKLSPELPSSENSPTLYNVMKECTAWEPNDRPSFSMLVKSLEQLHPGEFPFQATRNSQMFSVPVVPQLKINEENYLEVP